jgi:hypothetical protein
VGVKGGVAVGAGRNIIFLSLPLDIEIIIPILEMLDQYIVGKFLYAYVKNLQLVIYIDYDIALFFSRSYF